VELQKFKGKLKKIFFSSKFKICLWQLAKRQALVDCDLIIKYRGMDYIRHLVTRLYRCSMDYMFARLYEILGLLHIPQQSPTSKGGDDCVGEHRTRHRSDHQNEECDEDPTITLEILPTELLVYIISFVPTTRDRTKLRYVSRRLRSVSETPSLWREFEWPYYNTGNERSVTDVLQVCGKQIKRLDFPHHVIPNLFSVVPHCSNVVELSLPTAKLVPIHVHLIMQNMKYLQKLDLKWDRNIMQLLVKTGVHTTLKELTIRVQSSIHGLFCNSVGSWLHYWSVLKQCVPQRIKIVYRSMDSRSLENSLLKEWQKCKSDCPAGHTGYLSIYDRFRMPMNLVPASPVFQLEFSQTASLPYVSAGILAQPHMDDEDLLLIVDGPHGNIIKYRSFSSVKFPDNIDKKYLNCNVKSLNSVVELDLTLCELYSEHLEYFSVACPNLRHLNLQSSDSLKSLCGLHAIASSCHHLQGLNLLGIRVKNVENQIQLWEILSEMKLTHLALDLCILLPSSRNNQQRLKLISLLQKCVSLRALEASLMASCHKCSSRYVNNSMLLLSHLPSLQHLIINAYNHCMTFMQDIISSCKELRYFIATFHANVKSLYLLSASSCNLQELYIEFFDTELPDSFMNTISAHGGLVHVIVHARSVTSEGITTFIRNSPNLLTLHAFLYLHQALQHLDANLKGKMSHRKLFTCGSYKVVGYEESDDHKHSADLLSFW